MDESTQQRLSTVLAAAIGYGFSQLATNRFLDIPEQRGIKDDVLEAVLKGANTALSTLVASIVVRRILSRF